MEGAGRVPAEQMGFLDFTKKNPSQSKYRTALSLRGQKEL